MIFNFKLIIYKSKSKKVHNFHQFTEDNLYLLRKYKTSGPVKDFGVKASDKFTNLIPLFLVVVRRLNLVNLFLFY